MEQILVLNNRRYRICDLGEGDCTLIITVMSELDSLTDSYLQRCEQRLIVLDISTSLPIHSGVINHMEIEQLIDDIHLLMDIYWLDEAKIVLESNIRYIAQHLIPHLGGRFIVES